MWTLYHQHLRILSCCYLQMEEMLDCYKRQLDQKDREIRQLARYQSVS